VRASKRRSEAPTDCALPIPIQTIIRASLRVSHAAQIGLCTRPYQLAPRSSKSGIAPPQWPPIWSPRNFNQRFFSVQIISLGIGNVLSLMQMICMELWACGGELDTAVRPRDPSESILQKCDFFVVRPPR